MASAPYHELNSQVCRLCKKDIFSLICLPRGVIHIITKIRLGVFKGKGSFKQKEIFFCLMPSDQVIDIFGFSLMWNFKSRKKDNRKQTPNNLFLKGPLFIY